MNDRGRTRRRTLILASARRVAARLIMGEAAPGVRGRGHPSRAEPLGVSGA